jgi:hypothetical protein
VGSRRIRVGDGSPVGGGCGVVVNCTAVTPCGPAINPSNGIMNRSEHMGTQQSLRVNADFDERVIINTQIDAQASNLDWVSSPS